MQTLVSLWWKLIQFGFHLLYNQFAWTYDAVSVVVSFGQWHSWQQTSLKHLNVESGARVLELAHGTGNLEIDLHNAGYKVIGYDLSPYMGRITQPKLTAQGIHPQLHLCSGNTARSSADIASTGTPGHRSRRFADGWGHTRSGD